MRQGPQLPRCADSTRMGELLPRSPTRSPHGVRAKLAAEPALGRCMSLLAPTTSAPQALTSLAARSRPGQCRRWANHGCWLIPGDAPSCLAQATQAPSHGASYIRNAPPCSSRSTECARPPAQGMLMRTALVARITECSAALSSMAARFSSYLLSGMSWTNGKRLHAGLVVIAS